MKHDKEETFLDSMILYTTGIFFMALISVYLIGGLFAIVGALI